MAQKTTAIHYYFFLAPFHAVSPQLQFRLTGTGNQTCRFRFHAPVRWEKAAIATYCSSDVSERLVLWDAITDEVIAVNEPIEDEKCSSNYPKDQHCLRETCNNKNKFSKIGFASTTSNLPSVSRMVDVPVW